MKKTLLLTITLAAGLLATAQTGKINNLIKHNDKKHLNLINSLLHAQQATTAQKPTGTAQRVIAQVSSDTEGYSDSSHFKYTGTKGSRYDHNVINFGYNLEFGSSYAPMPDDAFQYEPLDLLADSISSYENNELYQFAKGFYRSDNKLDSFTLTYLNGSNPPDVQKTVHSFYPGGYIKEIVSLEYNGTSYDTNMVRRFSYNNSFDKIVTDTSLADIGGGFIQPYATIIRHYNAQGNIDTITNTSFTGTSFEIYSKTILGYTTSGKMQKVAIYIPISGDNQYQLFQVDSFAYANNADYFTFWEYDNFDNNGEIESGSRIIKYPGANGMPDSLTIFNFANSSNWEEEITLHYTYNNFDNPETLTATIDGEPIEGMITFYYETYEDGLAINPIANNKDFSVYPNPFSNNINIDWKGKQQSNVTIRLTNIVGQEVYKTSMKLVTGKNAVSIPSLNSGNYILLIQDADGKSWSSKMVKK